MPTADSGANQTLTANGAANASEGYLNRSADGAYLIVTGYDAALGTAAVASSSTGTVARTIGRVGADGSIDTTTTTTSFSGSSIRSAASADGSGFWSVGNATGVVYTPLGGSGAGTVVSNVLTSQYRTVGVFGGQLYITSSTPGNAGVNTVGVGLPTTTEQPLTRLSGLSDATNPSNYGFFFADLSTTVTGVDTLYIADDKIGALGKFSFDGSTWLAKGTIGVDTDDYRGLTGSVSGTTVTLYATRKSGTAGELVTLTDTSGFGGTLSGTPSVIATGGTNTAFRGVAMAPVFNAAPVNSVQDQTTNEDVGISLAGLSIADPDAGTANIQVKFSVPAGAGAMHVQDNISGGVTAGQLSGNFTDTVTMTAPLAAIKKTIENTPFGSGIAFFPASDVNGPVTITMTTNDLGNSGFGGAKTDTDTFIVTVFSVNDAPVNKVPGAQSGNEDTGLVFSAGNGNLIGVTDADAGSGEVKVTLAATNGTVFLGGTTNLTVTGNGTATVVATGKVADLNAGLAGSTFSPAGNFHGSASIQITTDDQGNSGSGGAKTDTDTVAITVNSVNDPPVLNDAAFLVNKEAPAGTVVGTITATDVENETITYAITAGNTDNAFAIDPATGKITVATPTAVTGTSFSLTVSATDNGAPNESDTATVTVAVNHPPTITEPINDAAIFEDGEPYVVDLAPVFQDDRDADSALSFLVAANSNPDLFSDVNISGTLLTLSLTADAGGSSMLTIRATDTGGLFTDDLFALFVSPLNDAPTLTAIADRNVNEDDGEQLVALTGISPGPADESSQKVTISATSDNPALIANPTIEYTGGTTGTLKFTSAPDADGTAVITVTVTDDGGTNNGGADTLVRTFVVTVNPVNDSPTLDTLGPLTLMEDAGEQTVPLAGISAGPANESGQVITVTATSDRVEAIPHPSVQYEGGSTAILTFNPVPNANGEVTITVIVTDDGGTANGGVNTTTRTFTVTINPVNDAPVLDDAVFTANQNAADGTLVGTVTATDADNDPITYSITAGNNGAFVIDPATGQITVADSALLAGGPFHLTVSATDAGVPTANDTATVTITVNARPTTSGIADRTVLEDATDLTFDLAAAFEDAEQGDGLTYTIPGNSDPTLFADDPIVAGTTLKLTPRPDAFGNSAMTVRATDNGGLFVETTFIVTVTAVNDAPTLGAIDDVSVAEDAAEQTIGLAGVSAGAANESGQGLTVVAVSGNPAVVPHPTAVFDAGTGWTLKFTPVPNAHGSAEVTVTVTDDGGAADGGVNTVSQKFTVGVGSVDDRPVVNTALVPMLPPAPVFGKVLSEGGLIADLVENVTDADTGALKGVAIVGVDNAKGKWQYNLGAGWLDVPAVSPANALLLADDGDTRVRFVPKPRFNGYASVSFRAWDRSNGLAEGKFDDATDPVDIAFGTGNERGWVAVGRAKPKVDADGRTLLPAVREDAKVSRVVSAKSLLGLAGLEALPKTNLGVAVIGASTASGTWQYRLAKTKTWNVVGAVSDSAPLHLRPTDSLRFMPVANADGEGTLTFKAWDTTNGTTGTDPGVAALDIAAVNDAPVLDLSFPAVFDPVDAGQTSNAATVASLMSATDVEGAAVGVAVFQAAGTGRWQFRLAGGAWTDLPKVTSAKSLLLAADTELQFIAGDPAPAGTATLSFRAWDGTNGKLAGTQAPIAGSAFGKQVEVLTVAVKNEAPELTDANPTLPAIQTTAKPRGGVLVSSLLGANVNDPNGPTALEGIAVVAADNLNGKWQYTLNGTTWADVGSVSEGAALLLKDTNRLRFVPAGGFVGMATIQFKAWDQSAGRAGDRIGTTGVLDSFSTFVETATITVTA
jgi:hypothetical protein